MPDTRQVNFDSYTTFEILYKPGMTVNMVGGYVLHVHMQNNEVYIKGRWL